MFSYSQKIFLNFTRYFKSCSSHLKYNQPLGANELPRPGGIASMMRLPVQTNTDGLDACFVGICLDAGTSNRSGTRFGPRQIRTESVLLRPHNMLTGAAPFESLNVADIGDVFINIYNLPEAICDIKKAYGNIIANNCKPLTLGGDHTLTYPILQAMKNKYGPVGLIHIDAHLDTNDTMAGSKIAHGTPFRRAVEENLLDCKRVAQIGIRGPSYSVEDVQWSKKQGFRVVLAAECWHRSLTPLITNLKQQLGSGPVYVSLDIDSVDPGFAPGTGTPEIAGLTPIQVLEIIHGCRGLNIIGCDVVEVSPPYDVSGNTALLAANFLYELLCVLPGVKYYN